MQVTETGKIKMQVTETDILSIIESAKISLDLSRLNGDTVFKDAGVDSLDMFNVFLGIEEHFGVTIPDEDIDQLKSVNEIVAYLQNL